MLQVSNNTDHTTNPPQKKTLSMICKQAESVQDCLMWVDQLESHPTVQNPF